MLIVYGAGGYFAPLIAPVFHGIFDIFFGFIQVFVFVLLSAIFISSAIGEEVEAEILENN